MGDGKKLDKQITVWVLIHNYSAQEVQEPYENIFIFGLLSEYLFVVFVIGQPKPVVMMFYCYLPQIFLFLQGESLLLII